MDIFSDIVSSYKVRAHSREHLQRINGNAELWLDALAPELQTPEQVRSLVQSWKQRTGKKIIAVCKGRTETGQFSGSESKKVELLIAASQGGVDYVDLGILTKASAIKRLQKDKQETTALILSFHDFKKTPSQKRLEAILKRMRALKPDVIKIATMVKTLEDNRRLIELAQELTRVKQRHIVIGMGELGRVTRYLSPMLGNELEFVSTGEGSAPGQLTLEEALNIRAVLP